jgi:hypothetical protein
MIAGRGPNWSVSQVYVKMLNFNEIRDGDEGALVESLKDSGGSHAGCGGFQPIGLDKQDIMSIP